jgi:hypothetical protein
MSITLWRRPTYVYMPFGTVPNYKITKLPCNYHVEGEGWIDMLHFFAAAEIGKMWGDTIAQILGWANEVNQVIKLDPSGHPFGGNEDLASNKAGANYGDDGIDDRNLEVTIIDWIEKNVGKISEKPPSVGSNSEPSAGSAKSAAQSENSKKGSGPDPLNPPPFVGPPAPPGPNSVQKAAVGPPMVP